MTMCRSRPSTLSAATYAVIISATAATAGIAFVAALFLCRWRIASVARHTQSLVTRQCGAIVRERAADVGYTTSAPAERPLCPCVAAISAKRESTLERRAVCSCAEGGEEEEVKRWEHGPYACNGTSAGCTFFPETRDNLRPAVSRARRDPVAPPTHPSAPSVPAAGGRGGLPPPLTATATLPPPPRPRPPSGPHSPPSLLLAPRSYQGARNPGQGCNVLIGCTQSNTTCVILYFSDCRDPCESPAHPLAPPNRPPTPPSSSPARASCGW